jgi:hypothetical protein
VSDYLMLALVLWPAVTLVAAGVNMLVSWTFAWGELVMCYVVGVAIGSVAWASLQPDPHWIVDVLLVMGLGPTGILRATGALDDPAVFFWTGAGITVGSTLAAAVLDRVAVAAGATMTAKTVGLSFATIPFKLLAAPFTSAVGFLIMLVGGIRAPIAGSSGIGFLGGIVYFEWNTDVAGGEYTTTVGCTVHSWIRTFANVMEHELYHTRQCIYLHDFMTPAWAVGEGIRVAVGAATEQNPLEQGAYGVER